MSLPESQRGIKLPEGGQEGCCRALHLNGGGFVGYLIAGSQAIHILLAIIRQRPSATGAGYNAASGRALDGLPHLKRWLDLIAAPATIIRGKAVPATDVLEHENRMRIEGARKFLISDGRGAMV